MGKGRGREGDRLGSTGEPQAGCATLQGAHVGRQPPSVLQLFPASAQTPPTTAVVTGSQASLCFSSVFLGLFSQRSHCFLSFLHCSHLLPPSNSVIIYLYACHEINSLTTQKWITQHYLSPSEISLTVLY